MIKLQRPLLSAQQVFTTCISRIKDQTFKQRLISVTQDVVMASNNFDAAAAHNRLHQITQQSMIGGSVTRDEMIGVYTNGMRKKGSPGRAFYDALITLPERGICPLCAHREVATLDHHLPKAQYPLLAVAPLNLVPACYNCNYSKQSNLPTTPGEETLHPYFDDINQSRWLHAVVIQGNPAALRFFVRAHSTWTSVLTQRVNSHFRIFELAELYAAQAANELANIRHQLQLIFVVGGENGVRTELEQSAISRSANNLNGWAAAAYEAFASNTWFCSGGFN